MVKKKANGEGSLMPKKSGGYELQITIGIDAVTGKIKRKSFSGKTIKEVRAKEKDYYASLKNGTFIEPNKILFGEWMDNWLKNFKYGLVEARTYDYYESHVKIHLKPQLGYIKLQDLKTEHIQKMYNSLFNNGNGISASTVKHIHVTIKQCLEKAVELNYINKNPSKYCILPKDGKEIKRKVFNSDEILKIMEVLDFSNTYDVLIMLDFVSGLRKGEIIALTWEDIDFDNERLIVNKVFSQIKLRDENGDDIKTDDGNRFKYVFITKTPKTTSSNRVIPIPKNIIPILKKHKLKTAEINLKHGIPNNENSLVFPSEVGTKLNPENITRRWISILNKVGVDYLNFHCIRHTFATQLLEKDVNVKSIQDLLGHSSIRTTLDIYSHVSQDSKKDAISKLNDILPNNTKSNNKNHIEETAAAYHVTVAS